jgi:hypothetical protein
MVIPLAFPVFYRQFNDIGIAIQQGCQHKKSLENQGIS